MSTVKKSLWNKDYTLVVLVNIFASIGFYFVQPTLPRYVTGLGVSLATAGFISGMFSIVALFCRPFTGAVADRISPKKILQIALPMEAAAGVCYGLIPSVPWLILCRTIHAIGFSFVGTVIIVFGSQFIPRERMGEGIGYLGMGNILGTAIGPGLGLALGSRFGYKYAFICGGLIILAGFPLILLTENREIEVSSKRTFSFRNLISVKLIPLSFLNGLFSFSNGLISAYLSMHADVMGITGVGAYFTVLAAFLFIVRPIAGKWTDKHGLLWTVVPGYIMTGVGLLMIANARSLGILFVAAGFMAFGQGGAQPAFQSACVKALPNEQRGIATSTYYMFADVFQGFGPMIGGRIAELTSPEGHIVYTPLYTLCSSIMAAGLVLFMIYNYTQKKKGIVL